MHFVSPGSWNLPANDVLLYGAGGVVYTAMLSAFAVTSPPCPSCKRDPPGPWALHSILIVTWEPGIANSELHTSHQLMELFEHVELEEVDRSRHVPYLVGGGGGGGDVGLYEFELSLYALFTLLSEARLPPGRRRAFYALLGDRLLAAQLSSSPAAQPATGSAASLKRVEAGLEALLEALQRAGYLAGFKIDNSDADEALWAQRSELSTTRYTITLANPASLRAATQLNAASGGRVTAGLAVPLLLAFLRASGVTVLQQSEYFLDDEYKPNPIAYNPSSLVVELEIAPVPPATSVESARPPLGFGYGS